MSRLDEILDRFGEIRRIPDPDVEEGLYIVGLSGPADGLWRILHCRAESAGEAILLAEIRARRLDEEKDAGEYRVREIRARPGSPGL